jgi:glycosyltransferase involved in cell wall biosynthesis
MPSADARGNVALVVTTYNRPDALARVLASISHLIPAPDEVVIADDGSGQTTAEVIKNWQSRLPILHVWHADLGFRAAEARNKAVAACKSGYLIFLDGDCLVFPDFIARHRALSEPGRMLVGNRVLLSEELTEAILSGLENPLAWRWPSWWKARLQGRINRLLPLLHVPGRTWRLRRPLRWQGVHTCNLGVWRDDFDAVNGFDERYQGWGHEDADLAIRLMQHGVMRKDGQYGAPVMHLWHRENDRSNEAENQLRLDELLRRQRPMRAELGVDRHYAAGVSGNDISGAAYDGSALASSAASSTTNTMPEVWSSRKELPRLVNE